jgi:predicted PurR-regulated permease PerM
MSEAERMAGAERVPSPTDEGCAVPAPKQTMRIVAAGVVVVLAAGAMVYVVIHAWTGLVLIAVAAFLAAALNHGVEWLQQHRFSRTAAITCVMAAQTGIVIGIILLLVPPVARQVQGLIQRGPQLLVNVRESSIYRTLDEEFHLTEQIQRSESEVPKALQRSIDPAVKAVSGVFSVVAGLITLFFLTVFMLIFGGRLVEAALYEALPASRVRYRRVLDKIYHSIGGYLGGILFICLVNATLTTSILAVLRVPFFLPLGILSGSASLVPYAGPVVIGTSVTLFSLATVGPLKAGIVAIFYVLYGQLEGNVLGPLVFRRTVNVNPLVSIVSLVLFGELAGVPGAIAAVPLAAMGQVVLRELLVLRRERLNLPLTGEAGSVQELPQREIKKLAAEDAAHKQRESRGHS